MKSRIKEGSFAFEPIGVLESCFKEKFGVPRQPGIVRHAHAVLKLKGAEMREAVRGLEGFSHVWLVFVFHDQDLTKKPKPTVRPPRLGGAKRMGVLASRSPHRPNPIGISAVKLESIEPNAKTRGVDLHLRGADLVDGTPILDVKPYVPYADVIPDARDGWAAQKPERTLAVEFSPAAANHLKALSAQGYPNLKNLITEILALDPRPAFQARKKGKEKYAMRLQDFDVRWEIQGDVCTVLELTSISPDSENARD